MSTETTSNTLNCFTQSLQSNSHLSYPDDRHHTENLLACFHWEITKKLESLVQVTCMQVIIHAIIPCTNDYNKILKSGRCKLKRSYLCSNAADSRKAAWQK